MPIAMITGVSRGLGHGIAVNLLERGWEVLGLGRQAPEDLTKQANFHFAPLDLQDYDSFEPALIELLGQGKPELLILNAGILGEIKRMSELSLKELDEVFQINLWANKILLDHLLPQTPELTQVVAISSGASVKGHVGWGAYALSKAGLNMLVTLYAVEHEDVHFASLAPGLVDTQMQDYLCGDVDEETFPSILKLKAARGTSDMPSPIDAGELILDAVPKLLNYPSGSYLDIRKL